MYHLAQLNIAKMNFPYEDERFADFIAALDPVNTSAEVMPGFIWRLQTDEGNATSVTVYDDEMLLVNMSVWESLEHLVGFVRSPAHLAIMRRRREWFAPSEQPYLVLWWVPAGHEPDVAEAEERLEYLRANGPSSYAFSFSRPFEAPETHASQVDFREFPG
jgi:heme-degrading monooxygenase HmoA